MNIKLLLVCASIILSVNIKAQTDKADADQLVYEMLTAKTQAENWHPRLIIVDNQLFETAEKGIYIVPGDSFQIKTMRSDFYVYKQNGQWTPINDPRYPMETMVNLLLNRITDNKHTLLLRHHQYGGKIPTIAIPMQNLFDILARTTQVYCSVNAIDKDNIRATLVFHQQKLNYIHLVELNVGTQDINDVQSTFNGELYTNIPQGNIKDIFRERIKNK